MKPNTMRRLLVPLLVALLAAGGCLAEPCPGDPNHDVTDSWTCDDNCNTCTCGADGTVEATGRCCSDECQSSGDPTERYRETFEATIVRVAVAFALLVICSCLGICYLMCVRGGKEGAGDLVRELEEAEQ